MLFKSVMQISKHANYNHKTTGICATAT